MPINLTPDELATLNEGRSIIASAITIIPPRTSTPIRGAFVKGQASWCRDYLAYVREGEIVDHDGRDWLAIYDGITLEAERPAHIGNRHQTDERWDGNIRCGFYLDDIDLIPVP